MEKWTCQKWLVKSVSFRRPLREKKNERGVFISVVSRVAASVMFTWIRSWWRKVRTQTISISARAAWFFILHIHQSCHRHQLVALLRFSAIPRLRLEAIYMMGVDDMSTQEIFRYFKEYPPAHIEWINDTSCRFLQRNIHSQSPTFFRVPRSAEFLCVLTFPR